MATVDSHKRIVDNNVATIWTCNLSIPSPKTTLREEEFKRVTFDPTGIGILEDWKEGIIWIVQ